MAAPTFEQWGAFRVQTAPLLGRGLTSRVHLATRDGAAFALKRYATGGLNADSLALLKRGVSAELAIMQGLVHPHIVRVHGEVDVGEDVCIVLDFAPGGTAQALARPPRGSAARLPIDQLAWLARDIAQALAYVHGNPLGSGPVVHRDIKPGNIVFAAGGEAQLTDFGSAALLQDIRAKSRSSTVGTEAFMAPEMHMREAASRESDVWMYGATLLCLLTGEELAEDGGIVASFRNRERPWTLEDHVHCRLQGVNSEDELVALEGVGMTEGERSVWLAAPADLKDLIQCCLRRKKAERCSAAALLAHPFVASVENWYVRRAVGQLEGLPQWPFPAPQEPVPEPEPAPAPLPGPEPGPNFSSSPVAEQGQEMKAVMVGLDGSGKTTILYKLKLDEVVASPPTIGYNVEKISHKNL